MTASLGVGSQDVCFLDVHSWDEYLLLLMLTQNNCALILVLIITKMAASLDVDSQFSGECLNGDSQDDRQLDVDSQEDCLRYEILILRFFTGFCLPLW